MDIASDASQSRYYQSQGLQLHFTDWGNAAAPPLLLVHGGLDHSRSWDHLARALRADFHVVAPDQRGHGDSGWATGSSYSLADHVYDLTGLIKSEGLEKVTLVGHSMGGMVSLTYAGAFPDRVSKLVVLDGVTNFPARRVKPIDVRIAEWVGDLDKTAQRKIHRYPSVADDIPANTVTDDLIRTVFEIDVRVQRHSDGTPLVLPQLMTAIEARPQGMS